jgi:hypothetical protein
MLRKNINLAFMYIIMYAKKSKFQKRTIFFGIIYRLILNRGKTYGMKKIQLRN